MVSGRAWLSSPLGCHREVIDLWTYVTQPAREARVTTRGVRAALLVVVPAVPVVPWLSGTRLFEMSRPATTRMATASVIAAARRIVGMAMQVAPVRERLVRIPL